MAPSPNGRDGRGRFTAGNRGGPGNPHAKRIGQLRASLLSSVTPKDISEIVRKLVALAKAGDVRAVREVMDRTLGRPIEADLIERLEELEALASSLREGPRS
jgi:hypothetical protein